MSERLRSALFVDFDNMFGGLFELDRAAALQFAETPEVWLRSLSHYGLESEQRDFLIRRAYLNPAGWIPDEVLGNDRGRLYLSRFRPNLTQAGFEVVDCPALTYGQKNAADIRIVLDVVTALDTENLYDECVIASSDSDFTPLLQRLRAADRRTVIMSTAPMSPAYRNVAHTVVPPEAVIDLAFGLSENSEMPGLSGEAGSAPSGGITVESSVLAEAESFVREHLGSSSEPIHLGQLGNDLRRVIQPEVVNGTQVFGFGSMSRFVESIDGGVYKCQGFWAWDPERHSPPSERQEAALVPPTVERLARLTDLPRLTSQTWVALLDTLIRYSFTHSFNLTEATAWARDELADTETPTGRAAIGFVVRALGVGGASLASPEPPNREQCITAVVSATCSRAEAAGWELGDNELGELKAWLSGEGATNVNEDGPD